MNVPSNTKTSHATLVFRASGQHLPKIKTENEVAVMTWVKQNKNILIPDLVAFDSSTVNAIGHEYTLLCWSKAPYSAKNISPSTETHIGLILDRLADYLSPLHAHAWDAIGGLRSNDRGTLSVGQIVDKTFWQALEVKKLWSEVESADSLNIGGPCSTYVDLLSRQVRHTST